MAHEDPNNEDVICLLSDDDDDAGDHQNPMDQNHEDHRLNLVRASVAALACYERVREWFPRADDAWLLQQCRDVLELNQQGNSQQNQPDIENHNVVDLDAGVQLVIDAVLQLDDKYPQKGTRKRPAQSNSENDAQRKKGKQPAGPKSTPYDPSKLDQVCPSTWSSYRLFNEYV